MWPAGLGREENRRRLEDLIGPAQLGVLPFQPADLRGLLAGPPRPPPGVDLGLADPLAQRLRRADPQFRGHGHDRWPVRRVVRPHLGDHPDCTLPQLRRVITRSTSHGSIFSSRSGASGLTGAVHYDIATDVPDRHRLRIAFDDLAITI